MVYVRLKPSALLLEILRLESGKVASDVRRKARLALQGGDDGLRRVKVLPHLVEHVLRIRLHTLHGHGYFLRNDILQPDISYVGLSTHHMGESPERHSYADDNNGSHDKQYIQGLSFHILQRTVSAVLTN